MPPRIPSCSRAKSSMNPIPDATNSATARRPGTHWPMPPMSKKYPHCGGRCKGECFTSNPRPTLRIRFLNAAASNTPLQECTSPKVERCEAAPDQQRVQTRAGQIFTRRVVVDIDTHRSDPVRVRQSGQERLASGDLRRGPVRQVGDTDQRYVLLREGQVRSAQRNQHLRARGRAGRVRKTKKCTYHSTPA